MAQPVNQFYYVEDGRPILKTEYNDGSEDFYDASGQFPGQSWGHLGNGTVVDPFGDAAQSEADRIAGQPNFAWPDQSQTGQTAIAAPTLTGGSTVPNPLSAQQSKPPVRDDWATNKDPYGGKSEASISAGQQNNPQNMDRYDWAGNPRQAMMNAMADMGNFQLTNNPYVDRLLSAAPGLATSFMADKGLSGANQGDVANSYGSFATFLRQILGSGDVFNKIAQTSGQMPQLVNAVRGYNEAGKAGGDPNDPRLQNPFIRQLASMFGANNNQGALQVQGQLQSPFLTQRQQNPFADMMETRYTQGAKGFYGDPQVPGSGGDPNNPGTGGNDWWKYLFGY